MKQINILVECERFRNGVYGIPRGTSLWCGELPTLNFEYLMKIWQEKSWMRHKIVGTNHFQQFELFLNILKTAVDKLRIICIM